MEIKKIETISILGLGLLGGSVGLAVNRVFPHIKRIGYSHRPQTRQKAVQAGVVDEVCSEVAQAVRPSQMVILASPIGTFPELMAKMAKDLPEKALVTDVGSTKVLPARWARQYLPRSVEYIGSHPMAGSEQRGVDFARADLFDGAYCIITPTSKKHSSKIDFLSEFWKSLGMHVSQMTPARHDRVLSRISHLPHLLAAALVNISDKQEMELCGKGFLDTTRIASGPPNIWRDILMGNAHNTAMAVDKLIRQLQRVQQMLEKGDQKELTRILTQAQSKRNQLVEKKLRRKELPT